MRFFGDATRDFAWDLIAFMPDADPLPRGPRYAARSSIPWHAASERLLRALLQRRHERAVPVFQGRFHSQLVEDDEYLAQLCLYVAVEPAFAPATARTR